MHITEIILVDDVLPLLDGETKEEPFGGQSSIGDNAGVAATAVIRDPAPSFGLRIRKFAVDPASSSSRTSSTDSPPAVSDSDSG